MLPGKKGIAYCPFNAIEAELSEDDCKFLSEIHGKDLTLVSSPSEDSKVEKLLNILYDFSKEKPELRHKQVIRTDCIESTANLGPYEKVFHVIY